METQRFIHLADRASIVYALAFTLTIIGAAFATNGLTVGERGVVGGDFLAFHTAGQLFIQGKALSAYEFTHFDAALKARAPLETIGMMWQYPPVMFLIAAPFALLPYKFAYLLWIAAGWSALGWCLHRVGFRGAALRILIFSPLCVAILSHGQISHLTAGLLFLAVYKPNANWLMAGIAAGLLTIKPQLGLLIPFAFLTAGAWRTIGVAALTAFVLHSPSLIIFAAEGWRAFFDAVLAFNSEIAGTAMLTPPRGMTTLFGQLRLMGVSGETALAAQYGATALLAALTIIIWRKPLGDLHKAAFVGAAAIIAAPYAYGYEMTALLLAAALLAKEARTPSSPLGLTLICGWFVIAARPFLPELAWLNTAFAVSLCILALVAFTAFKPTIIDREPVRA